MSMGTVRVCTVSEAVLWDALFGPRYTAHVAGVVCSGQGPVDHGIIARLAKEARATRLAHVTATSLKVFLLSPVFGKQPKLVKKGTAAALALRTGQYQALPFINNITSVTSKAFATGSQDPAYHLSESRAMHGSAARMQLTAGTLPATSSYICRQSIAAQLPTAILRNRSSC